MLNILFLFLWFVSNFKLNESEWDEDFKQFDRWFLNLQHVFFFNCNTNKLISPSKIWLRPLVSFAQDKLVYWHRNKHWLVLTPPHLDWSFLWQQAEGAHTHQCGSTGMLKQMFTVYTGPLVVVVVVFSLAIGAVVVVVVVGAVNLTSARTITHSVSSWLKYEKTLKIRKLMVFLTFSIITETVNNTFSVADYL